MYNLSVLNINLKLEKKITRKQSKYLIYVVIIKPSVFFLVCDLGVYRYNIYDIKYNKNSILSYLMNLINYNIQQFNQVLATELSLGF